MSHNLWFLWLMIGLKLPLIGLFYFIFRILRAQDKAWEQGELDGGFGFGDSDDGGGGGEPRVKPPTPPRGPRRPAPPAEAPGTAAGGARPASAPPTEPPRRAAAHPRPAPAAPSARGAS